MLLPAAWLSRRADAVSVIGAALLAKAAGSGHRPIASALGRPASTVRGWLRRFGALAEVVRVLFTVLLHSLAPQAGPLLPRDSVFADALEALGACGARGRTARGVRLICSTRRRSGQRDGRRRCVTVCLKMDDASRRHPCIQREATRLSCGVSASRWMQPDSYRAIADTLRTRINSGAYSAGTKLPAIAELMREFDVPGLNTIRDAQQLLVREGLIRTEQGVGAWVISRTSPTADQTQALREARAQLDQAIAYLEAQNEGR